MRKPFTTTLADWAILKLERYKLNSNRRIKSSNIIFEYMTKHYLDDIPVEAILEDRKVSFSSLASVNENKNESKEIPKINPKDFLNL